MRPEFSIFATAITDTKVLYRLIDKLSEVVAELYHNKEGTINQKVKNIGPSLGAIFNVLEQKGLEPSGDAAQKAYIEEIIKYLRGLPIVKITMAFEPDDTFSTRLNEVISTLAGQKVVLDISVNHHIVAGLIIEYQGKFVDYSYETRTNLFLKEKLLGFLPAFQNKAKESTVQEDNREYN